MGECRKSHMSRYLLSKVSCYHVMALCTYFFFFFVALCTYFFSFSFYFEEETRFFIIFRITQSPYICSLHSEKFLQKKSEVSRWKRLFFLSWEVHKEIITCGQECWTRRCAEKYVLHNLCPEYLKKYLYGYSGSKLVG